MQLRLLCLLFQLIPAMTSHRTSKHERLQFLRSVMREKYARHYYGVKVTCMCDCGLLHLHPAICLFQALADSSVLSRVSDESRSDFIVKLTTAWLPDKTFELLYHGSRDGMTAAAFHDRCDGKGPTLVLVAGQSEGQPVCVFGGYASKSWERGPESGEASYVDARDSFLFTLLNPFGDGIVKMAVNEASDYANWAMRNHSGWGPWFGCSFSVWSKSWSPTALFDGESCIGLWSDGTFGDPLGRGWCTFTGARLFKPLEVEVWSVC
jgi:hypothetical protein